jgi:hypothetical protein
MKARVLPPLALAAGLLAAPPAGAAPFGIEGFGAFNTHAMTAWNTDLELANAAGGDFGRIDRGVTGGLGGRIWVARAWMIHADWEPFSLDSHDAATGRALVLDATSIQLGAAYFFPARGGIHLGLGAGLGRYALHGAREFAGTRNAELTGSTVGPHFLGLAEWRAARLLAVTGAVGYRMARVTDTRVDGRSAVPKLETDYSGMMLRLGVAVGAGP